MKKIMTAIVIISALSLGGCAKFWNRVDADGGFFGSYPGNYIVLKYNGGKITDLWKLRNVMLQSEAGSDGWLFKDNNGHMVHIGGDMKSIRVDRDVDEVFSRYTEYHMEIDGGSYEVKKKN